MDKNDLPSRISQFIWISCKDKVAVNPKKPGPPNLGFFIHWHICVRGGSSPSLITFSGFLPVSGEACHEYSLPPVITQEVSKTSRHLGWCRIVGSGAQACSQVFLAAAAGFVSMQLGERVWWLLGAKLRPLFHWHLSEVQGCREIGRWHLWSIGHAISLNCNNSNYAYC